jgi:hypothetical protein
MKLEKVEHLAEITLAARQLGRVGLLPQEEVCKLVEMRREKLGLPPEYKGDGCVNCGACGREPAGELALEVQATDSELARRVAGIVSREVQKQLS